MAWSGGRPFGRVVQSGGPDIEMSNLEVTVTRHHWSGKPVALVALRGLFDTPGRAELAQTIRDLLSEHISYYAFDLSEVKTIDSQYLRFFIKIVTWVRGKSGRIVFFEPSQRFKTAFEVIGLGSEYISIADANNLEKVWELLT
jgi:anti-anti-sigma regulatory factor